MEESVNKIQAHSIAYDVLGLNEYLCLSLRLMKPQSLPTKIIRENALRLLKAGQSSKQIATALNIPIGKIYYWRNYYLHPRSDGRRLYDGPFKQNVLDQIAAGRSISQLAQSYGVSKVTLFKWKREFNQAQTGREIEPWEDHRKSGGGNPDNPQYTIEGLLEIIRGLEEERNTLKKALQTLLSIA